MNPITLINEEKIRGIILTDKQKEEAYYEWQKRIFFHERSKEYWLMQNKKQNEVL